MFVHCLGIVLSLLSWLFLSCSRHYRLKPFVGTQPVPGEQPDWVVGNLRHMGVFRGVAVHRAFMLYQQQWGDIFQYFFGNVHRIAFCRPEHAQHVLSKRAVYEQAASLQQHFGLMFPKGLVCLTGATHRRHARVILPMLKKSRCVDFISNISDATDLLISQWFHLYQQQPDMTLGYTNINLLRHMQTLTLDIITEITYGESCQSIQEVGNITKKQTQQITTVGQASALLVERFASIATSGLPNTLAKYVLKCDTRYQQARQVMLSYVDHHIAESNSSCDTTSTCHEQVNLLQRLVATLPKDHNDGTISDDKHELNHDEVVDELMLLIVAGYETLSTVLSWFIVFMCKNPMVQRRIKDEIRKVIPKDDKPAPISQSQLDELEYMDAVVKETLRLAPTFYAMGRIALVDDVIDGIEIKAGQEVDLLAYNIHTDPRYWSGDPLQYDPDRFYGENAPDKNHHPYAFLPFGGGAHACAGQELARTELKTIMTRLMQRVTFHDTLENNVTEIQRITCTPGNTCISITFDD